MSNAIRKDNCICEECSRSYWVKPYRVHKSRFCSFECGGRFRARETLNRGPKPWAAVTLAAHRHKSTSRFSSGHQPWNKGVSVRLSPRTEFKPGRDSERQLPPGHVSIRNDKAGKPRAWVKTQDGWMPRAQLVYTAKHGAIPGGHIVHHRDGDTLNDRPSNLIALTPADHIREHLNELREARRA